MPLTASQLTTLKNDLAANTNTVLINGVATAINAVPHGAQNAQTIADWYNQTASPAYQVIRTDALILDIYNNIIWPNYTPNFTLTTSTSAQQANQCACASALCQGKQMNLQNLFIGRTTFDATKSNQTAGLKDATTNLPAGASFANVNAGWQQIIPVLNRAATYAEKLFVTAAAQTAVPVLYDGTSAQGTTGNPALMGFEGQLTALDIENAWVA